MFVEVDDPSLSCISIPIAERSLSRYVRNLKNLGVLDNEILSNLLHIVVVVSLKSQLIHVLNVDSSQGKPNASETDFGSISCSNECLEGRGMI